MKTTAVSKKSSRPNAGKLIEHQQQAVPPIFCLELLGQSPADLVEHKPHQRLGAADVGGRYDKVKRGRAFFVDEFGDPPVAPARDLGDDGIAVEAEEAHGGLED